MDYRFTTTPAEYAAFFLAENKITHPAHEYIIHLAEPRCLIKYDVGLAMFASYDDFFHSIAEVQWLDGPQAAPKGAALEDFFTRAWNYLAIEERILEADAEEDDDDDDF